MHLTGKPMFKIRSSSKKTQDLAIVELYVLVQKRLFSPWPKLRDGLWLGMLESKGVASTDYGLTFTMAAVITVISITPDISIANS